MKESDTMVGASLIKQAAKLLEAVPDSGNPVIEVCFDAEQEVIEVWNMLADKEVLLGTVAYD